MKHEVDIIAEQNNKYFLIECKFHNQPGIVCDVKIPLYIHSRFKDVEANWLTLPGHDNKLHQGWVVTNTRFTSDAIQYGTCVQLNLLGWDYPSGNSLNKQIDESGLYPITCLTSLTQSEKQNLLNKQIVLCKEISGDNDLLRQANISIEKMDLVIAESQQLCKTVTNKF